MNFSKWIQSAILENTQYEGNSKPHQKVISASDFGNDLLQIYYRYKFGVPKKQTIGQDTIGTVVHKGIETIFKTYADVLTEVEMDIEICNGWKLSGTADIAIPNEGIIADVKVTKQYTLEKLKNEPLHSYRLQLNVYRYLYEKLWKPKMDNLYLIVFLKDGGYDFRKMKDKPSLQVVQIDKIPDKIIEKKFHKIVNAIETYEELDIIPDKCQDVWMRKTKNGSIPVRCMQYCAYNNVCKYFNPKPTTIAGAW